MLTVGHRCRYLLRGERRGRWLLVVVQALVVSIVEAFGALLVFVLLGLVAAPDSPVELPLIGDVSVYQEAVGREAFIIWLAAGVGGFFVVRGLMLIGQVYVQERLAHNAGARLSARLLGVYLSMPYVFHLRRNSAELIRNAHESIRAITREVLIPGVRLLSNVVLALGMLGVLFYAAPLATLMAIGFLGPMVAVLIRYIHPRLKTLGRRRQAVSRKTLQILQQALHGIREVTLFGRKSFFLDQFARQQNRSARVAYLSRVGQEVPRVMVETVLVLFIAGFLVVTVSVQGSPEQGLAVLGLFAYAALRLQPSLHKIVQSLNSIKFAGAAIDHVYEDLKLAEAGEFKLGGGGEALPNGPALLTGVRLENVTFHYSADAEPALREISMQVGVGESIGIVGPTGGGKSTLLDILTGLLAPTSGAVRVDGMDLARCRAAWQAALGVVSQSMFLLDDTLRRNIALGLKDHEIDEAMVQWAVELAQLSEFVGSLPQGLDTRMGEHGTRLSGGQRQRVAIARALYRDPQVLIFDEGTSALDNVTEAELMAALMRLKGRRTLVTVAHRLSTVQNCDRIFVVEAGQITDVGTYEDMVARNPSFRQIAGSPAGVSRAAAAERKPRHAPSTIGLPERQPGR